MPDNNEVEISFSVKELLQQLNTRIDAFMTLLASKADQSSVAHVAERVDKLDTRVTKIEHTEQDRTSHRSAATEFRRWFVPVLISLMTAAVLIYQVLRP